MSLENRPEHPPEHHCIFCAIVAGRAPAHIVLENDLVAAFLDINPVTPGHVLIVPKRHAASLADLTFIENASVFQAGKDIASALRSSGLQCEGINYFVADGAAAFQEVFHFHLHVFPRYRGDSFRIDADWSNPPEFAALSEPADRIRRTLGARSAPMMPV
ncbi:HIT family protein [Microbaculum marinum]|uniref:HIT family protein n=1 Tax=Microbaculum marinum TaxID=1764581 RepID=A0AAW9RQ34_9HYPH